MRSAILIWLVVTATVPAAANPAPGADAWSIDDLLLAEAVGEVRISPEGDQAVWTQVRMDKEKGKRVTHLFLSRFDDAEGGEVQLTRGPYTSSAPRWSPDGRLVSFLSNRPRPEGSDEGKKAGGKPDETQLWLIRPAGGEPWPLTALPRRIQGYAWKDAGTLVYAAQEDPSAEERQRQEREDTSRPVEDPAEEPPVRLFLLEVKDGSIRRLTANDDWIDLLSVSPDGRWAVTRHQQSLSYEYDQKVLPVTFLTDLESGESRRLDLGDGRRIPELVEWQPDSRGFYFAAEHTRHPRYLEATVTRLYHYDLARSRASEVDLGWERGLGGGGDVQATEDGFIALLADGVRLKGARYRRQGEGFRRTWIEGDHVPQLFDWRLADGGATLLYERSAPDLPTQWYRGRLEGHRITEPRQLTHLNPGYAGKPKHRFEVVHFPGARGEEVEGLLYYPLGYEEGKRYPLILAIHGGPVSADLARWDQSWAVPKLLLTQKGAFVLEVNYHGSSNYGLDWAESIGEGRYYELEIPDLEAGADLVIARGLADPQRLATMGWSNGGILSAELITRTRRYKAASIGAADVEWISDWANVDFGAAFDEYYFGASPLENPQRYLEKSPFFRLGEVTTPTIVYTGTEDRNVPPSQSWSLFRALQQLGKTDVRFLLFPGEPHGLRRYAHQRRKVEEDLAWFDRHLFGTYQPPAPTPAEGSPLALALAKQKVARAGGHYGRLLAGSLAPEMVAPERLAAQGLEIARFEITRGQLAAAGPGREISPGTEDYPASGVSFEEAQAYAAWLSRLTGESYRLPREQEVRELYQAAAGQGGNTLDRWAGYTPNPEEAEALRRQAAELGGASPLLREVGSSPGLGEDPVFDLEGNVAEWVVGEDGQPKLLGGSADRSSDPKATGEAAPAYRGFRVVRER